MATDIFGRVETLWFGAIRNVQLGWNPLQQTLTLWMTMRGSPPPNWLRQLTVTLIHDDGKTMFPCRLIWKEFGRELLSPLVAATPQELAPFVSAAIIPCVPVAYVLFHRGRRSRKFPNASSYRLQNGGFTPPESSS